MMCFVLVMGGDKGESPCSIWDRVTVRELAEGSFSAVLSALKPTVWRETVSQKENTAYTETLEGKAKSQMLN